MAVAMATLDAVVHVRGPGGEHSIPVVDFHRLPGDDPARDNVLEHGDLIIAVDLPALPMARRSTYVKVRDRASYAFALVSVAAALDLDGDTVRDVRLALGGVAHKPWRASRAEAALRGQPATPEAFAAAADAELTDARPLAGNAFKVPLAQGAVVRALNELRADGATIDGEGRR
jgi:xanthine dehydrogenase YagS FAD-binding subunit